MNLNKYLSVGSIGKSGTLGHIELYKQDFSSKQNCGYSINWTSSTISISRERWVKTWSHQVGDYLRAQYRMVDRVTSCDTLLFQGLRSRDILGSYMGNSYQPSALTLPLELILPGICSYSAKSVLETKTEGKKMNGKWLRWLTNAEISQFGLCCLTLWEACKEF